MFLFLLHYCVNCAENFPIFVNLVTLVFIVSFLSKVLEHGLLIINKNYSLTDARSADLKVEKFTSVTAISHINY